MMAITFLAIVVFLVALFVKHVLFLLFIVYHAPTRESSQVLTALHSKHVNVIFLKDLSRSNIAVLIHLVEILIHIVKHVYLVLLVFKINNA